MMRGLRTSWPFPLILLLSLSFFCCNVSGARHHPQKHPSAVVVGAVYCDTCFQDDRSKGSHYISGATVAVECAEGSARPAFHQEVTTDKQGSFRVHLPFSVSKHVKKIEGCTVKLVKSSEPYCAVASAATSSSLRLKERKGDKHIYSAGFFTFKPLKQPGLCNQQPSVTKSQLTSLGDMLPPLPNTDLPGFLTPMVPPLPQLPVPPLPFTAPLVPTAPGSPLLPNLPLPTPGQPIPLPQPQLPTMPFPTLPPFMPPLSGFPGTPADKAAETMLPPLSGFPGTPAEKAADTMLPPLSGLPGTPADKAAETLLPPLSGLPGTPAETTQKQPDPTMDSKFFFPVVPPIVGNPPTFPNPFQQPPLLPNPFQPPATPFFPLQPPSPPSLVPGIPTIPTIPTTPTIPTIPNIPGLPGLPGGGIPGIPVLTPSPPPPASFLPPLPPLLPGFRFPGIPPAMEATKMNP